MMAKRTGDSLLTVRHLALWLGMVGTAVLVGTAGYMALLGWSFSDAVYMTVITLTTVGFREVETLDTAGRILTMVLAGAGAALIFGSVGLVAEYAMTATAEGRWARRRERRAVERMSGHYLVCGYGRVGATVARELADDGIALVVVEHNPEPAEAARAAGHLVVAGDATDDAALLEAGADRAAGLVVALDSDVQNLYIVLSARTLNAGLLIVARASDAAAAAKLQRAGADQVVSPYEIAGHRMAALVARPGLLESADAALRRSPRADAGAPGQAPE
jgi:voltage-gated potassium channel